MTIRDATTRDVTTRVLTWNIERSKPETPRGAAAIDYLFGLDPDVMVITEARTTFSTRGGHTLWCEPPVGTHFAAEERKVLIWSKEPWTAVDRIGIKGLDQTRYIAAKTSTPNGDLTVHGVCIPWHMAEVVYHNGVKRKPWELHLKYLALLGELLHCDHSVDCAQSTTGAAVVAGDFNQYVPRQKFGSKAVNDALTAAFEPLTIATSGIIDGCDKVGIGHIAHTQALTTERVWGWPNVIDGKRLSDHDGAGEELSRR